MRPLLLLILAFATLAQQKNDAPKPPPETFIQWLARVTGVSAITTFSSDISFAHIDKPGSQRLTFDGSYVIREHLANGEATKDNILDGLRWLEHGDDADIRLVFLSGHGGLDTYGNYYFYSLNHDPRREMRCEIGTIRGRCFLLMTSLRT